MKRDKTEVIDRRPISVRSNVKQLLRYLFIWCSAATLFSPAGARSEEVVMATLKGPGDYQLSGSTECGAEATSTIKPGERFVARELPRGEGEWEVHVRSGVSGSIPRNRIRLLPAEPLARLNFESCKQEWRKLQSQPVKMSDPVAYSAKKYHGVANYYRVLVRASEGDARAFRVFNSLGHMDGEAGEAHEPDMWALLHVAGDDTFARLLAQSSAVRPVYAAVFETYLAPASKRYLKQNFPKTCAILYRD